MAGAEDHRPDPSKKTARTVAIRPLRWPHDRPALLALDTSFTTDHILEVAWTESSCELVDTPISPARSKTYELDDAMSALPSFPYVVVAEIDGAVVGMAALRWEEWNRRAVLEHLYVDATSRGKGVGRLLLEDAIRAARDLRARCLFAETQNTNPAAITFYRRFGFTWRGLDRSLYEPAGPPCAETALFFALDLP